MMLHKLRYLFISCLIGSILIPYAIFQLYDMQHISSSKWIGKQDQKEIVKKHPIIASIYDDVYNEDDNQNEYIIDAITQYDTTTQAVISSTIKEYEKEINTLLKQKILRKNIVERDEDEDFTIEFGTLKIRAQEKGLSYLSQIYDMSKEVVKDASFKRDKSTGKITSFTISNPAIASYTNKEKKAILSKFIHYLALDEQSDWVYTESSFESYTLRIQIYMDIVDHGTTKTLTIGICPLGLRSSNLRSYTFY